MLGNDERMLRDRNVNCALCLFTFSYISLKQKQLFYQHLHQSYARIFLCMLKNGSHILKILKQFHKTTKYLSTDIFPEYADIISLILVNPKR